MIQAIRLKNDTTVGKIWDKFEQDHKCDLSPGSWQTIMDRMIYFLSHKLAREYKGIPSQLVDLILVNPESPINLNIDIDDRFLRLFVGFLIALHVGNMWGTLVQNKLTCNIKKKFQTPII